MSNITIYHKDGTKTVIGDARKPKQSYEAASSLSAKETVLRGYKMLESEGRLRPEENTRSFANWVKRSWENA